MKKSPLLTTVPTVLALLLAAGCGERETVSYATDVQPVLAEACLSCHVEGGEGTVASGFSMASYDDLMKGTDGGPMVIPGDSLGSNLVVLMEGRADPSIYMPRGAHDPVSQSDIDKIKTWIEEGAKNN